MDKVVLVSVGDNKRVVSFSSSESSESAASVVSDLEALSPAIRVEFGDILQPGQDFFLQLKSEEWGGVYIDLRGSTQIADRSVVKVVMKPATEVSRLAL